MEKAGKSAYLDWQLLWQRLGRDWQRLGAGTGNCSGNALMKKAGKSAYLDWQLLWQRLGRDWQ